jgi:cysteinyl-tRNA synthetase
VTLVISNTLSGQKEPFVPLGPVVSMYVCGMTPKFHPHVGHARVFVAADIMRRYLEYSGFAVKHVQNFTDIDDKIIARGEAEGISAESAARKYTDSYFESMRVLNVKSADVYPTVTGSMSDIIKFTGELIGLGFAYQVDGDVYFEVSRFPEYGKLSGRTAEGQLVAAREGLQLEPGKRDPRDFALWKAAKPGEPFWESPWGHGRPGWHIECSTMVRETLGDQIDIHSGGRDLIFPHHENEIAQSEARTGRAPFARYWAHVGLVTTPEGEKQAHSLGNFTTIEQIVEQYDPVALRLFLLSTHYRQSLTFGLDGLSEKSEALDRLRNALRDFDAAAERPAAEWTGDYLQQFRSAMDDDFNSAAALGVLFELARETNRRRAGGEAAAAAGQALLVELADVLGLDLIGASGSSAGAGAAEPFVELLIDVRKQLREARQWQLADQIRNELRARGVILEDQAGGSVWRWARPGE